MYACPNTPDPFFHKTPDLITAIDLDGALILGGGGFARDDSRRLDLDFGSLLVGGGLKGDVDALNRDTPKLSYPKLFLVGRGTGDIGGGIAFDLDFILDFGGGGLGRGPSFRSNGADVSTKSSSLSFDGRRLILNSAMLQPQLMKV